MTSIGKAAEKRWYQDACGTALALEFVGERWSLLILRELMFGGRRFGEIKAQLAGISANVLTQRLTGLEEAGLLRKRTLPPPASVQVYELTPWGLEVEPIFQAMGRWALRSRRHDPTMPLSPASAMLSLRTMLEPDSIGNWRATIGFRLNGDQFLATVAEGEVAIERADPDAAEVVVETDTTTLIFTIYGKQPITVAEADGRARLTGDRAVWDRFVDLFALPAKLDD